MILLPVFRFTFCFSGPHSSLSADLIHQSSLKELVVNLFPSVEGADPNLKELQAVQPPLWLLQWLNLIFTMLIISYVHLWTYSVCLCVISLCNRSWLNCYKRFLVCVGSQSPGSWEKAAGGLLLFPRMFASHPEVFFSSKESQVFNSCVRWSEGLWININHVSGHMSQSVKQGF